MKIPDPGQITLYDRNSREEEAELSLKHTVLSKAMGWTLVAAFLVTIFSEPITQGVLDVRDNIAARQNEIREQGNSTISVWPRSFGVVSLLPSMQRAQSDAEGAMAPRGWRRYWKAMATPQDIRDFADDLAQNSAIGNALLPRVQLAASRSLGLGNEKVYPGRSGWLFYRPDVDYLTGPGFLGATILQQRARSGDESEEPVQPDPEGAIVDFKNQLAKRGVTLVLVPAPLKPTVQPDALSSGYTPNGSAIQNPSYEAFVEAMTSNHVLVFDPTPVLTEARGVTGKAQFLKSDTHWTPQAMELSARALAAFIRGKGLLPVSQPTPYKRRPEVISNLGDIAEMLKLPPSQTLYQKQSVTIHQVTTADGELWSPERTADVLLLGDSFCNIYSLEGMNWGESAGFAEQLSFELQRPLDVLTNNAGGSFFTRQRLVKELNSKRGKNRLSNKKLVIWEFAMRDLSSGDWKVLRLPPGATFRQPMHRTNLVEGPKKYGRS